MTKRFDTRGFQRLTTCSIAKVDYRGVNDWIIVRNHFRDNYDYIILGKDRPAKPACDTSNMTQCSLPAAAAALARPPPGIAVGSTTVYGGLMGYPAPAVAYPQAATRPVIAAGSNMTTMRVLGLIGYGSGAKTSSSGSVDETRKSEEMATPVVMPSPAPLLPSEDSPLKRKEGTNDLADKLKSIKRTKYLASVDLSDDEDDGDDDEEFDKHLAQVYPASARALSRTTRAREPPSLAVNHDELSQVGVAGKNKPKMVSLLVDSTDVQLVHMANY